MAASKAVRIGTRKSRLALAQAEIAMRQLRAACPSLRFEIVTLDTAGDRDRSEDRLGKGTGIFVKELERALLRKKIDLAIHSLKDLPTETPPGLVLAAVLKREDSSDALVTRDGTPLDRLPAGSRIGTSSLRRQAFLRAAYGSLRFEALRGNLDTRIEALLAPRSLYRGIVVATAGLRRLYGDRPRFVAQSLCTAVLPPAPGQGAICLQARAGDSKIIAIAAKVDDPHTNTATRAERAILRRLEGGCNVPIAALAEFEGGILKLSCWVASLDGSRVVSEQALGMADDVEAIADALEIMLKNHGAPELISEIRRSQPHLARLDSPPRKDHNHRKRTSKRTTRSRT
ncbi:MAG TPA: hydroxymethylbilane synthase [Planctomycetota bacterium]|nr:hydroxymethylbilane synthase [Planctomycetota bacterium]